MHASTSTLLSALFLARSEAVKQRARVTVCRSTVGGTPACAGDGTGFSVFLNVDDDATFDPGSGDELIRNDQWLRAGVTLINDGLPDYVSYVASGFTRSMFGAAQAGDIVFCDDRGDVASRVLRLPATGRPQVVPRDNVMGAPSCAT